MNNFSHAAALHKNYTVPTNPKHKVHDGRANNKPKNRRLKVFGFTSQRSRT